MDTMQETAGKKEVPFDVGYLTLPLTPREQVRLLGTKCANCGAVVFGTRQRCENCTSVDVQVIRLGNRGKVWSYTVVRYPPPPPYKPAVPFVPLPAAWVELPERVKILSYLKCNPEEVDIGMEVELALEKGWEDEEGNNVIIYKFKLIK